VLNAAKPCHLWHFSAFPVDEKASVQKENCNMCCMKCQLGVEEENVVMADTSFSSASIKHPDF